MKLSLMSYTLARQGWDKDGTFDFVGMARLAQELAIDGVDVVTTYGVDPREVRRVLEDHGLRTVCHTFGADLNHATRGERSHGVDEIKEGIEIAVALGTDKVMVCTGGKPATPRAISRRQIIAGLAEGSEFARRAGIMVTVENHQMAESPFIGSADILEAVREVPGLKITFDGGNALTGDEDPALSFERSAAHVVHAHCKDWIESPAGWISALNGHRYDAALVGEGVVDHQAVLTAMQRANYAGYINLEYEGTRYKADEATCRAAAYLRRLCPDL